MTSSELQFAVIKDELTAMVDDIIRQFLNDKVYEKDQAQNWCNGISDEIIKALHQQQRGFKFVSAQPAYGILTKTDLSLLNMKMTKCTLSSAYSVLLLK